jgi:hypothetical protein
MGSPVLKHRIAAVLGILALLFLVALSLFYLRAPLLVLTDDAFDELYGPARVEKAEFLLSLRVFRPLREIRVALAASPDGATIAAVVAGGHGSRLPSGVLFPWRYRSAAEAYSRLFPSVPVAVLGGPSPAAAIEGPIFQIPIDRRKDMLRAGIIAGMIAEGTGKAVFVLSGGGQAEETLANFRDGLSLGGFSGELRLADPASPQYSSAGAACIVVPPDAPPLPAFDPMVPTIWFTWIDPDLLPPHAVAVFDDSLLVVAPYLVQAVEGTASPVPLPSLLRFIPGRSGLIGNSLKKRIMQNIDELDVFYADKYLSAVN